MKKEIRNGIIAVLFATVLFSSLGFLIWKTENPIEKTWAKEYIKSNIAHGWGIKHISCSGTVMSFYEVYVQLFDRNKFNNNEAYQVSGWVYFDNNGVLVRTELGDIWKKK